MVGAVVILNGGPESVVAPVANPSPHHVDCTSLMDVVATSDWIAAANCWRIKVLPADTAPKVARCIEWSDAGSTVSLKTSQLRWQVRDRARAVIERRWRFEVIAICHMWIKVSAKDVFIWSYVVWQAWFACETVIVVGSARANMERAPAYLASSKHPA
jgi:hypothetical protein